MKWRARGSREARAAALGGQLVDECESFLDGSYPSVLEARGLPVPEWAWLSVLAHAPLEALEAHAAGLRTQQNGDRLHALWEGALSLLSCELLAMAEQTGTSVEKLQHSLVTDIELDGHAGEGSGSVHGPSRMVEQVRDALDRHRDSHRR